MSGWQTERYLNLAGDGLGELMSEETRHIGPEAPLPGRAGQTPGRRSQGQKPFWRRTPVLMAAPPLTFLAIVVTAGCVSSSASNPAAAQPSGAPSGTPSGIPSGTPSGIPSGTPSGAASPA